MADVRQLTFSIGYRINDTPIRRADDAVDDYQRNVVQTDRTMVRFGRTVQTTGRRMQTLGSRTVASARNGQNAFESFNRRMKIIGGALLGYFSFQAIKRGFLTITGATADLEEETAKFGVVFGDLAPEAAAWAEDYSDKVGRSANETKRFLADNQNLLVGFGATRKQGKDMAIALQQVGVDLASFNNEADPDVLNKLTSGLLGNHLAVKSLGIALTEASLAEEMQNLGLEGNFSDLDQLTKMQVRFGVVVSQSQDAMGDAEATSGSYTNQLKRLGGNFEDAFAQGAPLNDQLGQFFVLINENFDVITKFIADGINVAAEGLRIFGEVLKFTNENSEILIPLLAGLTAGFAVLKIAGVIVPMIAALGPVFLNIGIAVAAVSSGALTFGAAFTALLGPVGLVVLAIAAIVTVGVAVIRNWDKIKEAGKKLFDTVGKFLGIDSEITLNENKNVTVTSGRNAGKSSSPRSPRGFAIGTRSAPKGLGIINESPRGELVSFQGGERVRSAAEAGAATSNNTNNSAVIRPEINININGSNKSEVSIAKEVKKEIEQVFINMGISLGVSLEVN